MKISELIDRLQKAERSLGDLEVRVPNWDNLTSNIVKEIKVVATIYMANDDEPDMQPNPPTNPYLFIDGAE